MHCDFENGKFKSTSTDASMSVLMSQCAPRRVWSKDWSTHYLGYHTSQQSYAGRKGGEPSILFGNCKAGNARVYICILIIYSCSNNRWTVHLADKSCMHDMLQACLVTRQQSTIVRSKHCAAEWRLMALVNDCSEQILNDTN